MARSASWLWVAVPLLLALTFGLHEFAVVGGDGGSVPAATAIAGAAPHAATATTAAEDDSARWPSVPPFPPPTWTLGPVSNVGRAAPRVAGRARQFRFHVYDVPRKYIDGALAQLEERWATSGCNRHSKKSNYTMLDWRHAHSLFTADVFIARWLRFHPAHTADPREADAFVIPMMTHVYNCAGLMHYTIEILSWVIAQHPRAYKQMDHHDHYLFWWRWGMHHGSTKAFLKRLYRHFPNVNFVSFDYLELMGRNDWQDFTLALKPKYDAASHWVVMPYPDFSPGLTRPSPPVDASRAFFFYFAGTSSIGGIRRWIKRAARLTRATACTKSSAGPSSTPRAWASRPTTRR